MARAFCFPLEEMESRIRSERDVGGLKLIDANEQLPRSPSRGVWPLQRNWNEGLASRAGALRVKQGACFRCNNILASAFNFRRRQWDSRPPESGKFCARVLFLLALIALISVRFEWFIDKVASLNPAWWDCYLRLTSSRTGSKHGEISMLRRVIYRSAGLIVRGRGDCDWRLGFSFDAVIEDFFFVYFIVSFLLCCCSCYCWRNLTFEKGVSF